jgi:hypothetical protein
LKITRTADLDEATNGYADEAVSTCWFGDTDVIFGKRCDFDIFDVRIGGVTRDDDVSVICPLFTVGVDIDPLPNCNLTKPF